MIKVMCLKFKIEFIIILSVFSFNTSCTSNNTPSSDSLDRPNSFEEVETNYSYPDSIKRRVENKVLEGNVKSYGEFRIMCIREKRVCDLLYPSLIMANKYNNPEAHYYVFYSLSYNDSNYLIENYRNNILNLDNQTKKIALYYLIKAKEMDVLAAKNVLETILPEYNDVKSDEVISNFR